MSIIIIIIVIIIKQPENWIRQLYHTTGESCCIRILAIFCSEFQCSYELGFEFLSITQWAVVDTAIVCGVTSCCLAGSYQRFWERSASIFMIAPHFLRTNSQHWKSITKCVYLISLLPTWSHIKKCNLFLISFHLQVISIPDLHFGGS